MVASQLIGSSASVTVQTYTASNAPFMPDLNSAVQTSPTNLLLRTQFVRINAAPGQCLNFREVRGVGKGGRCFVTTCCGPVFYVHYFSYPGVPSPSLSIFRCTYSMRTT